MARANPIFANPPFTAALDPDCPVAMVTIEVAVLPPVSVSDAGFTVHVAFCGAPVQAGATVPVEPATGVTCNWNVAV
jgi:hypothetical protein